MGLEEIREDLGVQLGMAVTFSGKTNKQLRDETGLQASQLERLRRAQGLSLETVLRVMAACGKRLEVVDIDHTARALTGEGPTKPWTDIGLVITDEVKIMDLNGKVHTFTLVKE